MSDYDNETDSDSDSRQKKSGGSALPWLLFILTLLVAGAGGYFGFGLLKQAQDSAAQALKASDEANAKLKALEAEKSGLETAKKALEDEKGMLSNEVKEKDAELAKLKATYDNLQEKMDAEIKKGEIRLSQTGERIQVDMVDKILFDSGSADLSPKGQEVLARLGAVLSKVEDKQIQVSGHTDDANPSKQLSQTFPTNWELSVARAVNVTRFLAEKASVPEKRLVAAGYGQFHPIAPNSSAEGRAKNRRIEILLTPLLEGKPSTVAANAEPAAAAPAKPAKATSKGKVVAAKTTAPAKKAPAKKSTKR
jgi:chemotaxis protein MotB